MPTQNPKKKSSSGKKKTEPKSSQESSLTSTPPPLECTSEEYTDLLSTASSLTESEAAFEILDCARYGEVDSVRALIEIWSSKIENYINTVDSNGNSALHKAGASGHNSTVQLLLFHKAEYLSNSSKNTPLHWAAANGHEGAVEMILDHDFGYELDVLLKNEFGRSILTEGFSSQKTELVSLLLNHDSASEEKLLNGGQEVDAGDVESDPLKTENKSNVIEGNINLNSDGNVSSAGGKSINSSNTGNSGIIHEFDFLREDGEGSGDQTLENIEEQNINDEEKAQTLLIRELPIKNADTPFGETAIDDTTGLGIWCASLVMARWMASKSILGRFDSKVVLELGAGCGVPGLTVGLYSKAKNVYATDFNPATVKNLKYNIEINANRSDTKYTQGDWIERVQALSIDWDDESTWPDDKMDFIIGSDLIYQKSIVPLLKKVVAGLLKPEGRFLYTCPSDGRDGLVEFIDTMKKEGFRCTSEEVAPDLYRMNPLSNGDTADAFLHFYELPVTEYKLYEFRLC